MKLHKSIIIAFLITLHAYGQDTINYRGFVILDKTGKKTELLHYESITLYPDGKVTWRSEYDLSFEEKGLYFIDDDILSLNLYYETETPESLLDAQSKPRRVLRYKMTSEQLYILNDKGKIVKRIKDRSLKSWPWRLRYVFRKEK